MIATEKEAKRMVWGIFAIALAIELVLGVWHYYNTFSDDSIYMVASLEILHGQTCNVVSNPFIVMCNYEHPPLSKALDAASIYLIGLVFPGAWYGGTLDKGPIMNNLIILGSFLSYRIVQVLMGAFSVPLVYVIAYKVSKNLTLAVTAAALLVLEPIYSFFSRSSYLDIPMVFFGLCAYAVYFGQYRLGPVDEYWLSGIMLALSALCKETGVVFIPPLVAYHFLFRRAGWRTRIKEMGITVVATVAVFAVGLQLYDSLANTPFPTFVSQVLYMIHFAQLISCGKGCYVGYGPGPWYYFPVGLFMHIGISDNQLLLWAAAAWIPVGTYAVVRPKGERFTPENKLFVFAALLLAANIAENELIYQGGRILWIWYLLPTVPSLCLGGAYLLTRQQIPGRLRAFIFGLIVAGYVAAYIIGPSLLKYD